ncbi:MAG: hypothetical protein FJ218_01000 [Ignavibacteria bacterium]|nr:hypothetical protein [Ignavibacteria bacterium]
MLYFFSPSLRTLLVLLLFNSVLFSQEPFEYPLWFLEPERVACPSISVGFATLSHYQHNSVLAAKKNAIENSVRLKQFSVSGGEAFFKMEHGTMFQGNNFLESFDSSLLLRNSPSLIVLDSSFTENCAVVLVGDSSCKEFEHFKTLINVSDSRAPDWTSALPKEKNVVYQVGVEQDNYYELSSWIEAERDARWKLARSLATLKLQSITKSTAQSGQEIQNQEFSVVVSNAEITKRWRDTNNNIYYVLIRCPLTP